MNTVNFGGFFGGERNTATRGGGERSTVNQFSPFTFNWTPQDGLTTLPECDFNLASMLADNGFVKVDYNLDSDGTVVIRENEIACDRTTAKLNQNDSLPAVTPALVARNSRYYRGPADLDVSWVKLPPNMTLSASREATCAKCAECCMRGRCPYLFAGYIFYLRESGREDVIRRDREIFRQNSARTNAPVNDNVYFFKFPTNLYLDAPDDLFEAAVLLQERNYVSFYINCYQNGGAQYALVIAPAEIADSNNAKSKKYENFSLLKSDILADKINRTYIHHYYVNDVVKIGNLKVSVVYAAYIDYLKRTNRFEAYVEQRAAYKNGRR